MAYRHKPCSLGAEAAEKALRRRVETLIMQAPLVRREEFEGVHDMRVASRRLRAALKEHRHALDPDARTAFLDTIRQITRLLGRPRELDVMIRMLSVFEASIDKPLQEKLLAFLRRRRSAVSPQCIRTADLVLEAGFDHHYRALLSTIQASQPCFIDIMRLSLEKRYRRLNKGHQTWTLSQEEEDLHALRIAFKKLRYVCELFSPYYGEPMRVFTVQLKQGQQLLGAWNDLRVLRDEVAPLQKELAGAEEEQFRLLLASFTSQTNALEKAFRKSAPIVFSKKAGRAAQELFRKPETPCCKV